MAAIARAATRATHAALEHVCFQYGVRLLRKCSLDTTSALSKFSLRWDDDKGGQSTTLLLSANSSCTFRLSGCGTSSGATSDATSGTTGSEGGYHGGRGEKVMVAASATAHTSKLACFEEAGIVWAKQCGGGGRLKAVFTDSAGGGEEEEESSSSSSPPTSASASSSASLWWKGSHRETSIVLGGVGTGAASCFFHYTNCPLYTAAAAAATDGGGDLSGWPLLCRRCARNTYIPTNVSAQFSSSGCFLAARAAWMQCSGPGSKLEAVYTEIAPRVGAPTVDSGGSGSGAEPGKETSREFGAHMTTCTLHWVRCPLKPWRFRTRKVLTAGLAAVSRRNCIAEGRRQLLACGGASGEDSAFLRVEWFNIFSKAPRMSSVYEFGGGSRSRQQGFSPGRCTLTVDRCSNNRKFPYLNSSFFGPRQLPAESMMRGGLRGSGSGSSSSSSSSNTGRHTWNSDAGTNDAWTPASQTLAGCRLFARFWWAECGPGSKILAEWKHRLIGTVERWTVPTLHQGEGCILRMRGCPIANLSGFERRRYGLGIVLGIVGAEGGMGGNTGAGGGMGGNTGAEGGMGGNTAQKGAGSGRSNSSSSPILHALPSSPPPHPPCRKHASAGGSCRQSWHCATCKAGAADPSDCLSCAAGFVLTDVDWQGDCTATCTHGRGTGSSSSANSKDAGSRSHRGNVTAIVPSDPMAQLSAYGCFSGGLNELQLCATSEAAATAVYSAPSGETTELQVLLAA
jgi:hypothetical protein